MDEIVKNVRYNCFLPEYQEQATVEECVGIAISKYFEWDTRIFTAFKEALDDANFHTAATRNTAGERISGLLLVHRHAWAGSEIVGAVNRDPGLHAFQVFE